MMPLMNVIHGLKYFHKCFKHNDGYSSQNIQKKGEQFRHKCFKHNDGYSQVLQT